MQEKEIYSHHTFMFPFIFDIKNKIEILKGWEFKKYEDEYNEIAYFHTFFKNSMFTKEEDKNSAFYTKEEYKDSKFIICKSKEYLLNLKSVNLRMFKTGVGILSFHIENTTYKELKDILEINEFARRIYPEYFDTDDKPRLVADYIQLKDIKEEFKYTYKPKEIKLSKIITSLIPTEKITPAVDDRMFVISFYKNSDLANDLRVDYKTDDRWYEYLFIDADGKTVQNDEMQNRLITEASYPRWQNYGTMFGISKYSFVCLADSDFTLPHMKTMYFQMFTLLLMLRATLLRFSNEVSEIADKIDKEDTAKKVSKLYKDYIQFVNSFYFREITPKDQGLEIYEKSLDILKIERDIKDLDAEIEELHTYVNLKTEQRNTDNMNRLNKIAAWFVPISLVIGFFGMNIEETKHFPLVLFLASLPVTLVISYFIFKPKKGDL